MKPQTIKNVIICDLDGTLANIDHRREFLIGEKKDWKSFKRPENIYRDEVNVWCLDILKGMESLGYFVIFVSGRFEESREITQQWLKDKCGRDGRDPLYMRPDGDYRPDLEIKRQIFKEFLARERIAFVLDDREQCVDMWREEGLICLAVQGKEY